MRTTSPIPFLTYNLGLILFFLIGLGCNKDAAPNLNENPPPQEESLPQVLVNTNGNTIVDEPKIQAQMTINTPDGIDFEGKIGIEIRGKSSQMFPKKSYGFETWDEENEDLDVSLLGFPEEADWILHGPYSDKTLFRNILTYDLARDMGRYASRCRFVELTINGDYQGVYVFMEKLKRDKNRIDLNNLKEDENTGEDLTGGYMIKIDKSDSPNGESVYTDQDSFASVFAPPQASGQTIRFLYEDPKARDITPEQKAYISGYVNDFENALASDGFTDPLTGYANFIEVSSFIDFFLVNELSNNVDGYRLSTFLYKDKNGKLGMGPVWDFNLAFGNADYCGGGDTNVWAYKFNERCNGDVWLVPFWWDRLMEDPVFVARLQERWTALRANVFSEASISEKIGAYRAQLDKAGAINRNFVKWPVHGTYIWPNNYVGSSYNDDLGYFREWITDRLAWLDGAIGAL